MPTTRLAICPILALPGPKGSTTIRQSSTFWSLLPYLEQQCSTTPFPPTKRAPRTSTDRDGRSRWRHTSAGRTAAALKSPAKARLNLNSYNVNGQVLFNLKEYPLRGDVHGWDFEYGIACRASGHLWRSSGGNTDQWLQRLASNQPHYGRPDCLLACAATTNSFPGFPGFVQYSTSMINDPANGNVKSWKKPQAAPLTGPQGTCDPTTASGGHPAVVVTGICDGSVRNVSGNITLKTWNAVLTADQGETIGDDF